MYQKYFMMDKSYITKFGEDMYVQGFVLVLPYNDTYNQPKIKPDLLGSN